MKTACRARHEGLAALQALVLALLLSACASASTPPLRTLVVEAHVPPTSGPVYLTGDRAELGPWKADALLMQGDGEVRTARLRLPEGAVLEYKVTLGAWAHEGLGPSGTVMPNAIVRVAGDTHTRIDIVDFKKDPRVYVEDWRGAGVVGRLDYWLDVRSAHLSEARTVEIWLPPQYDAEPTARFPVLYMQDGQNLFDPRIANTGVDWGVDEAASRLVDAGEIPPIIVVGVWSTGKRRLEYAPAGILAEVDADARRVAAEEFTETLEGDAYVRFLVEELKPRIDAAYRTSPGPACTAIMGSSMGALIAFYAMTQAPDTFGAAAGLSMHWPIGISRDRIFGAGEARWRTAITEAYARYLDRVRIDPRSHRLWVDHGGLNLDSHYAPYQDAIAPLLRAHGFQDDSTLAVRVYPGTDHNEAAWRARLEEPLRFLYAGKEACHA